MSAAVVALSWRSRPAAYALGRAPTLGTPSPIPMKKLLLASVLVPFVLAACSGGGGGGGATTFDAQTYVGTWTGTWTNTTFSSTGAVTITVAENGGAYSLQFDMDGNVFGGSNPAPESLSATITPQSASLVSFQSSVYGNLTGTLAANGALTASGTSIPGSVDTFALTGTWTATGITANVTIAFDGGGSANGTATLTKQ
jgi:hypothetical protein